MDTTILFPDTNFFLQYRDPAEIAWSDIGAASEVTLMVCRAVQTEIDGHKADGNTRRARRARSISSKFRQMVTGKQPLILRKAGPKVTLAFAPKPSRDFAPPEALDLTRKDDQIVAQVLAATQALGGRGALLTDDTGMMLTADEVQLACVPMLEAWRAPPEKDERDKQIAELKAQVERLSKSAPQIVVGVTPEAEPLLVQRIEYPPLSPALVEEFVGLVQARYPMKTDFSREADERMALAEASRLAYQRLAAAIAHTRGASRWQAPSGESIEAYRERYEAWLSELRTFFAGVHRELPGRAGRLPLSFSLRNTGSMPADHVQVDVEALGGLLLANRPRKDAKTEAPPALPPAPKAPSWEENPAGAPGGTMHAMQFLTGTPNPFAQAVAVAPPAVTRTSAYPEHREPHVFHRRDWSPRSWVPLWTYDCTEFRHQTKGVEFDPIVIAPVDGAVTKGAICFRASARNLPMPVERTVKVHVEVVAGDTEAAARAIIPAAPSRLRFGTSTGRRRVDT